MVVVAIITGLAVPSFNSFIQNNRLTASTNNFVSAISVARSEAISRNSVVLLCIVDTTDGTNCDWVSEDWSLGWVVFEDSDGDGDVDDGEAIRYFSALASNQTFTRTNDNGPLWFLPNGQIRFSDFEMTLCTTNASESRVLEVNSLGRVTPRVDPPC